MDYSLKDETDQERYVFEPTKTHGMKCCVLPAFTNQFQSMRLCSPQLHRFPVGRCVHKYSKAKREVVSKKKSRLSGVGPRACRKLPTASRTSDMANKENELTCVDEVQAFLYSDNCGFPVNSTDSKMAGAGSKYSDYFTEVS